MVDVPLYGKFAGETLGRPPLTKWSRRGTFIFAVGASFGLWVGVGAIATAFVL